MSQNAYALFQTIKKIKGYIIMSLRSITNASLVLQNSRLIKTGSNIAGSLATTSMHVHNIQTTATPITANIYSALVKLSGARYIRITPLLSRAGETVSSVSNTCNVRVTGWDYVTTIGWVPTILYYQTIANALTTTTFTIYNDALKGINALFPASTFGIVNSPDSYWSASTTGSALSPANLVVSTFGYQYLELEFPTLLGDSGGTKTNAIITEFN